MIKNGLYNFFGTAIKIGLSILTIPALIHLLGTSQFGLYAIITAILGIASTFEGGISTTLTVYISQNKTTRFESTNYELVVTLLFILVILIIIITTIFLLCVAGTLSYFFDKFSEQENTILANGTILTTVVIGFRLLQQYFTGIEQGNSNFKIANFIHIVYGILVSLTTILSAYIFKSVISVIWSQVIVTCISVFIHYFYCVKLRYIPPYFIVWPKKWEGFNDILAYVFKTYFGTLGGVLFSYGDKLIVNKLLGLEIGSIYSAMTSITTQINVLSAMPFQALVPELSQAFSRKLENQRSLFFDRDKMKAAYTINVCIAFLIASIIVGISPEISHFLLKQKVSYYFSQHFPYYLGLLTLIYAIYSTNAFGYYVMVSSKNVTELAFIQLFVGLITLVAIWGLSVNFGLLGAVLGNGAYLLVVGFTWFASRKLNLPIYSLLTNLLVYFCLFVCFAVALLTISQVYLRVLFFVLLCSILLKGLQGAIRVFKANANFYYQI